MALLPDPQSAAGRPYEVASGVDALYLTGRSELPQPLIAKLEAARAEAEGIGGAVDFDFAGRTWRLASHGFQKWRYGLSCDVGQIGLTASASVPTVYVQPRAELLHAIGPADTAATFTEPIEEALGAIPWVVSRIDLHSDWQGLTLHRDLSESFVGRAQDRSIYEAGEECTGFTFGQRKRGAIYARVYDKTAEIEKSGKDYWFEVWGEAFDPELRVHRVEFEWRREGLRSMGLRSPAEVLEAVGDLWRYGTEDWLTLRTPTGDSTKSRWPVSPVWCGVQQSRLRHELLGLARLTEANRVGALRLIMPMLTGYASTAAVHLGTDGIDETLQALALPLRDYERTSGLPFASRVDEKRRRQVGA